MWQGKMNSSSFRIHPSLKVRRNSWSISRPSLSLEAPRSSKGRENFRFHWARRVFPSGPESSHRFGNFAKRFAPREKAQSATAPQVPNFRLLGVLLEKPHQGFHSMTAGIRMSFGDALRANVHSHRTDSIFFRRRHNNPSVTAAQIVKHITWPDACQAQHFVDDFWGRWIIDGKVQVQPPPKT